MGQSEKRILGWEPTVTQQGFDQAGNRVGLSDAWEIVTTTEPEWDDDEREKMLGLALYRAGICSGCGYPRTLHDPKYHFAVEVERCPIKSAHDRFDRIQGAADEKVREAQKDNPSMPRPSDGRLVSVRMKPSTTAGR